MPNNYNLKKIFTLSEIITILIIIVGLIIAIFTDEVAIKVIGFSISILAFVKIILTLGQRINIISESSKLRTTKPNVEFEVTEKKDRKATRFVIENYFKFSDKKEKKPKQDYSKEIKEDEGFRLIKDDKNKTIQNEKNNTIIDESEKEVQINLEENIEQKSTDDNTNNNLVEFDDGISSVKIISKTNIKQENGRNKTVSNKILSGDKEPEETPKDENLKKEETININFSYKGNKIEIPLSELIEKELSFNNEPRKELEYFLNKVLKLIRSVTNTTTATFILINYDKKEFIVEAWDSDFPEKIAIRKKIPFAQDIVTQIIKNLKPELVTEINPSAELDLIPYYISELGISSFFGIPVFYDNILIGVLCLDSIEENAYDVSLIDLIGQYAKLISSLIKAYTEKYSLIQDSKTLNAIDKFRTMIKETDFSLTTIFKFLLESASDYYNNMIFGIISENQNNQWQIVEMINKNYQGDVQLGTIIEDERSLAGQTLFRNITSVALPIRINDFRFNTKEQKLNDGFFISVPISSITNNYGALFVQGANHKDITQYDINIFQTLASHAASAIEQIQFAETIKNSSLVDLSTGLLNTPAFLLRLNEEVMRSNDFNYPMTLCLIEIDYYKALDPKQFSDRYEQALSHVIGIIQKNIRPYDLLGRADSKIFGVVLIDVNSQKAKIWSEKLRNEIPGKVLKINQQSFTVTVSIGVAQLAKNESIEQVIDNAMHMLALSKQKTNTVTVYE